MTERKTMPQEFYYEDFAPGQKFQSAYSVKVSAQEIKEFGEKYDPQPFHLDVEAGANSFFNGLAASGWLTAAIVMRMRVDTIHVVGGMIGAGVDEIRWTTPVRPGDSLRTECEIVSVRHSRTRPLYGVVKLASFTYNQRNEVVMRSVVNFLAPLRAKMEIHSAAAPQVAVTSVA
jgi:acyl dehydratase